VKGATGPLRRTPLISSTRAMMAHGDKAHSSHFDGKSPAEIQEMKKMMDAHVRQMIVDQN